DPRGGRKGLRARPRGRRADGAPARRRQRLRRRRAAAVAAARGGARERARSRGRLLRSAGRMTVDTLRLTAEEATGLLERHEVSSRELHDAYLQAIGERDGELHAYLTTVPEPTGDGVPVAFKDLVS